MTEAKPGLQKEIQSPENENWLTILIAFRITALGLSDVVKGLATKLQESILSEVTRTKGLQPDAKCDHCTNTTIAKKCPKGLCSMLLAKARKYYRGGNLLAEDTMHDPTKWYNHSWELTKYYFPQSQLGDHQDTGINNLQSLVGLIINCTFFHSYLNYNSEVQDKGNWFRQVLDVVEEMGYSDWHSVSNTKVANIFKLLKTVLTDAKYLKDNDVACEACIKLEQLENGSFDVSPRDVIDVLQNALKTNERLLNEHIQHRFGLLKQKSLLRSKLTKMTRSSANATNSASSSQPVLSSGEIGQASRCACRHCEMAEIQIRSMAAVEGEAIVKDIWTEFREQASKLHELAEVRFRNMLAAESEAVAKDMHTEAMRCAIQQKQGQLSSVPYKERKKAFIEDLMLFYKQRHSTMQITPMLEDNDSNIIDFYVPSVIIKRDRIVNSFKDIICEGSQRASNIFVCAESGLGKTSFCKFMILLWRALCQKDLNVLNLIQDNADSRFPVDVKELERFDVIFLILLKNEQGDRCDVDDMIQTQIVDCLGHQYQYNFRDTVKEILENEVCLVMLDGLEDWVHPITCKREHTPMPHFPARSNCSLLTTLLPWKLSDLCIPTSIKEIVLHIEGIERTSQHVLAEHAIRYLDRQNPDTSTSKHRKDFFKDLNALHSDIQPLPQSESVSLIPSKSLWSIPIMLLQLVCLWYDGFHLVKTKCGVYKNVLNMMFSRVKPHLKRKSKVVSDTVLPPCFEKDKHCLEFAPTIMALGKLAFTLFSMDGHNESVFYESVTCDCNISEWDLKIGLHIGILFKSKSRKVSEKENVYCFAHRSYQEMLCAVYLSSITISGDYNIVNRFTKTAGSVLDMSNVFIFICGMNDELAVYLTERFAEIQFVDEMKSSKIQEMLIDGHKERRTNRIRKFACGDFKYTQTDSLIPSEHLNFNLLHGLAVDKGSQCTTQELSEIISTAQRTLSTLSTTGQVLDNTFLFPKLDKLHHLKLDQVTISKVLLMSIFDILTSFCHSVDFQILNIIITNDNTEEIDADTHPVNQHKRPLFAAPATTAQFTLLIRDVSFKPGLFRLMVVRASHVPHSVKCSFNCTNESSKKVDKDPSEFGFGFSDKECFPNHTPTNHCTFNVYVNTETLSFDVVESFIRTFSYIHHRDVLFNVKQCIITRSVVDKAICKTSILAPSRTDKDNSCLTMELQGVTLSSGVFHLIVDTLSNIQRSVILNAIGGRIEQNDVHERISETMLSVCQDTKRFQTSTMFDIDVKIHNVSVSSQFFKLLNMHLTHNSRPVHLILDEVTINENPTDGESSYAIECQCQTHLSKNTSNIMTELRVGDFPCYLLKWLKMNTKHKNLSVRGTISLPKIHSFDLMKKCIQEIDVDFPDIRMCVNIHLESIILPRKSFQSFISKLLNLPFSLNCSVLQCTVVNDHRSNDIEHSNLTRYRSDRLFQVDLHRSTLSPTMVKWLLTVFGNVHHKTTLTIGWCNISPTVDMETLVLDCRDLPQFDIKENEMVLGKELVITCNAANG